MKIIKIVRKIPTRQKSLKRILLADKPKFKLNKTTSRYLNIILTLYTSGLLPMQCKTYLQSNQISTERGLFLCLQKREEYL